MFLFLRVFCQFQEFVKSFVFLSSVRSNLCPCFVVLYHYRRDTTHNSVSVFLKELTVQFYQFDSVSIQVLLCKFFIKTSSFHWFPVLTGGLCCFLSRRPSPDSRVSQSPRLQQFWLAQRITWRHNHGTLVNWPKVTTGSRLWLVQRSDLDLQHIYWPWSDTTRHLVAHWRNWISTSCDRPTTSRDVTTWAEYCVWRGDVQRLHLLYWPSSLNTRNRCVCADCEPTDAHHTSHDVETLKQVLAGDSWEISHGTIRPTDHGEQSKTCVWCHVWRHVTWESRRGQAKHLCFVPLVGPQ